MAMKKNKQLANRVPKKGMTITKSLGRYQRVGEKRRDNRDNCSSRSSSHNILLLSYQEW
jgi:hypothetical protein